MNISKSIGLTIVVATIALLGAFLFTKADLRRANLNPSVQAQQQNSPHIGANGEMVFRVTQIMNNSPAAQAGLRTGDLILVVNGTQLESINDLWSAVRNSPDKPVEVSYLRLNTSGQYEEKTLIVTPTAQTR